MSPVENIESVDPNIIRWQDWKTGGGNDESPEIRSTFEDVNAAIILTGAARLKISGVNPIHGSTRNEASYWGSTLRRKFKEEGVKVSTKIEDSPEATYLFIKIKK